jgi:hypothetical protein
LDSRLGYKISNGSLGETALRGGMDVSERLAYVALFCYRVAIMLRLRMSANRGPRRMV